MRHLILLLFLIVIVDPYKDICYDEPQVYDLDIETEARLELFEPEEEKQSSTRFFCEFCAPPQYLDFKE